MRGNNISYDFGCNPQTYDHRMRTAPEPPSFSCPSLDVPSTKRGGKHPNRSYDVSALAAV